MISGSRTNRTFYRNHFSPPIKLNLPVSPMEVVYPVTFLITDIVSYNAKYLFVVNGELA
jgi:hypothetical protein